MATRPITIHSSCMTTPDQHVHVKVGDRVRWHADHPEFFRLELKGGFFVDHPDDFEIWVSGVEWTDYYDVGGTPGSRITNYIFSVHGNCMIHGADGPPDIVIDSTFIKHPKKPPKKKK